MSDLFDTEEKAQEAISDFTNLLNNKGWKLIVKIMDQNIEVAREQLENGIGEDETKEDVERLRLKLKMYKEFRDTPQMMIDELDAPQPEEPNDDPYHTGASLDELKEARDKLDKNV